MITPMDEKEEQFQKVLDRFFNQKHGRTPFNKIQLKAWDHFRGLKLPNRKTESFRYVPLRKLFEKELTKAPVVEIDRNVVTSFCLPECTGSVIVLVNGRYSKELSQLENLPSRIVVASLDEAYATYSTFLNNHFNKTLKEECDPFVSLNTSITEEGVFIYLPPKTVVEKPIQILHLIDTKDDTKDQSLLLNSLIQVFVGSESEVEFVSSKKTLSGRDYFLNDVSDFAIDENAHVRYNQILNHSSDSIWHFDATRALLKKNSRFDVFAVTNGSQTVRTDYKVTLAGENSESALNGLWMLEDNHQFHTHILMDHQAPSCRSRQLFKGVLDDFSKSSFEGKILVRQAAQKTDAFQLNSNLALSEEINAYSKPNLEIFADDVKASHGATFGQIDREQLFCLKSRGISDFEAKNLLVKGFCKEIVDLIKLPSLQKILNDQVSNYRSRS